MIVEADEEQDDRGACTVGHPQLVLGDREEAPDVGQSRQLVDRRELAAQPPSFDGVADRPGEQPAAIEPWTR